MIEYEPWSIEWIEAFTKAWLRIIGGALFYGAAIWGIIWLVKWILSLGA